MGFERYSEAPIEHTVSAMIVIDSFELIVSVLFDTGALQGNYLNKSVADWMRRHGAEADSSPSLVCSAFNECQLINNLFSCNFAFNKLVNIAYSDTMDTTSTLASNEAEQDETVIRIRKRIRTFPDTAHRRRQRLKRAAFTAFCKTGTENPETSDDTTCIPSGNIWETSDDTSFLSGNGT